VGRDVRYGLLNVEGSGTVVEADVEVHALLSAGVDGLAARLHLYSADVVPVDAFERHGYVRQRRLADASVEEVGEPVLEGVAWVADITYV
jgi:hypothetical protein